MRKSWKLSLTDAGFQKICESLKIKSISDDTMRDLQTVADDVFKWSCAVRDPRPSRYKKKMERVKKHASDLRGDIGDVLFAIRVIDDYETFTRQLSQLIKRAEFLAQAVPKDGRGRSFENIPLRLLVDRLFHIYKAATGNRPTLSKNIYGEPGGRFFNFIRTFALVFAECYHKQILPKWFDQSLAGIIEDILYSRKTKKITN